jgi:hypothetical protein
MNQQIESPHQIISNILHENKENIPSEQYLEAYNALMQLNNQRGQNNDSSNEVTGYETRAIVTINEIRLGHFEFNNGLLPEYGSILHYQLPLWIAEWIIKQTQKRMENGFGYADFNFDLAEEFHENNCQRTDYEQITKAVIPILQSRGFDITLYHENTNFKEDNNWGHYNGGMSVWWRAVDPDVFDIGDSYGYMRDRQEFFGKTGDSYFYVVEVREIESTEEESDDEEEEPIHQYLCMSNVPQENRINHAMSFIVNRATDSNILGCGGVDIMLCQNECKLSYSEIKNEIVHRLQGEGFDVKLYYTEDNQFDEEHFDNCLCVNWKINNTPPLSNMRLKIERFPKTTDEYHQFQN